ncbi:hypothetical protein ASF99_01735 [Exiguobacterium sp. Leaf187]|uniref:MDR family MFS transporter n=1 Tax=Exiguobacterium sp. Leaf187 TaxID=1736294 RepID=UPI0006FD4C76|nr:MFS transporter [Exiguobacterium sp. Leaf187]KQS18637.1 hypothetical protein ASF99_01735 [Exiguobacterium sp. Leaf187]
MRLRELHINIKIRILINFLQKVTQMAIFPFMAIYFSTQFGLKISGILMVIVIIASLIASFYGGYLSDVKGRKLVLFRGELLRFFSVLLMALCNSPVFSNAELTFVTFLFTNILIGLITPANEAILMDVSTDKTRKMLYSINYWSINLSIAMGSLIGSLFYADHFFELLLATAFTSLICCALIQVFIIETHTFKSIPTKLSFRDLFYGYFDVLKDRIFLIYLLAGTLMLGLEFQLTNYISVKLNTDFKPFVLPFSHETKIDGIQMLGYLRIENTILVVVLGAIMLKMMNNRKEQYVLYIGSIIFALGFSLLAWSNNFYILLIATFIFTIGELMYVPIHQSLLATLIDEKKRSQYIAVNALRLRGAMLIGSFFIILGDYVSSSIISVLYAFIGGISVGLYTILYTNYQSKEKLNHKSVS